MFMILRSFFITLLSLSGLVQGAADAPPIDPYNGGGTVIVEDGENAYYTFTTDGSIVLFRMETSIPSVLLTAKP